MESSSNVQNMILHSVDIMSLMRRRPEQLAAQQEIELGLRASLELNNKTSTVVVDDDTVRLCPSTFSITADERNDLSVTVKLFLVDDGISAAIVNDILNEVQRTLGTNFINTLILSVPSTKDAGGDDVKEINGGLLEAWDAITALQKDSTINGERGIGKVGVSDFSERDLAELLSRVTVKPTIDQVNLVDCCVIPKDLVVFCKSNNMQLLTHNDPHTILGNMRINELLSSHGAGVFPNSVQWRINWIVRFTVMITCRGVVKSKGYIVSASRVE